MNNTINQIFFNWRLALTLLFSLNAVEASSTVLYNTSTHATVTPAEIVAGGTSWMVLDANNSRYSSYTHPAYYNTSVHQVLDSASGSTVVENNQTWILTAGSSGSSHSGGSSDSNASTASMVLYNTSTHATITPAEIAAGGTSWMVLDANNSRYSSYTHPAYYNTSVHQVLDSASGSQVVENNQTWILTAVSSGSSHSGGSSDSNASTASMVLYNTSTHATITPAEIAAGGTSWMVLDANNSRYSSYTHPAYYNTSVHQVLDSASGSTVVENNQTWILTAATSGSSHSGGSSDSNASTASMVLYNTSTHATITPAEIAAGGTSWMVLDANNSRYSSYTHPAYYNTSVHQVLDSASGSTVVENNQTWILTAGSLGSGHSGGSSDSNASEESNSSGSTLVLYNQDTMQVITPEQVASGATDWLLLSPARYPDKYTHPAYYNLTFHAVVENISGDVEQGWTLRDPSSLGENTSNPDLEKVLYNTSTHQVITRTQIAAGGTGWMALASGFVGNDGSTYSFPAYYNSTTHGVLDNSVGDTENGWILTFPSVSISVSSSTGGTVSGGGNVSKYNNVSLTALPDKGYVFVDWSGGTTGSNNPSTFKASSDLTVYANFTKDTTDSDGDGLSNYDELIVHDTNSTSSDTDGDGLSDKEEFDNGMNPNTSDKAMVDKIFLIMGSRGTTVTPYSDGWFYTDGRGWMYTRSSIYPYFYDHSTKGWMYFQSGHQTPRFYHYGTKTWMNLQSGSSTLN